MALIPPALMDRTGARSLPFLWYIRLFQVLIAFLVLILSAVDAHTVQSFAHGCSVPGKVAYNLACALITIIVLMYFIFSTGPKDLFRSLPWFVWGQLALDGVMWIFWVAAAATSSFGYLDLCNACPVDAVVYGNSAWACTGNAYYNDYNYPRDVSPVSRGLAGAEKRASPRTKVLAAVGRTALNSIMTGLFSLCFAATIWWVLTHHRRTAGATAPTMKPPVHEESGPPVPLTQQSGPVASNPQMQPNQYYAGQGQPQPQSQSQFPSQPQSQYPSQPQQDFGFQQQ
ncbi:hypothetical protein MMC07_001431 [Pseudocyphellaria aurata]|nr:hypothetical protein [Pseudocyphellaria aurata]